MLMRCSLTQTANGSKATISGQEQTKKIEELQARLKASEAKERDFGAERHSCVY